MNRLLTSILLLLFPVLVLADGSLSFAPPASDYSVIFLGNLFGLVDGVLIGSGSQILGAMFSVFNSAVLALGGIIIMYTLMVSTMNTAHEGQMLGQKWSSIWIPVRSTLGLALLIPKASGYCLMQIFVMWVVLQGVGAADKVWEAALSYLNKGGLIIQAQQKNPALGLLGTESGDIPKGAGTILQGQVCMIGLETQLKAQRQELLNAKAKNSGPCADTNVTGTMKSFCTTSVPDFVGSVNAINQQRLNKGQASFQLPMPNFTDTNSPYFFLNGICGTLKWNANDAAVLQQMLTTNPSAFAGIGNALGNPIEMNRAIAIQQMVYDLEPIARKMVNNNPNLTPTSNVNNRQKLASPVATQQFGVPYTKDGQLCADPVSCVSWGPTSVGAGNTGGVLLTGEELSTAMTDYNKVMKPTFALKNQFSDQNDDAKKKAFIAKANAQGWIMAGSYFFDLVKLQGSALGNKNEADTNTGLADSYFDVNKLTSSFNNGSCGGNFANLCEWMQKKSDKLTPISDLIAGKFLTPNMPTPPSYEASSTRSAVTNEGASTVYGFINNSLMIQAPGQPGLAPLTFANAIKFSVNSQMYYLEEQNFECGEVRIVFFSFCLGKLLGNIFYNYMFRFVYNAFLSIFQSIIQQVVMAFIMIPLNGMAAIFRKGVETLSMPGVNPIVALANMGAQYINFAGDWWIMMLMKSITSAILFPFGIFIFALFALGMPVVFAWLSVMVSIGFTTAYYIPLLPYMIFTFGSIAWLVSVIEAMVAAPIVALGVTHPEGHEAFGKGEQAIMILMNVFLRPAMMIIGYITAIALSYVGVWILNAGYDHAISFIQVGTTDITAAECKTGAWSDCTSKSGWDMSTGKQSTGSGTGGYTEWAGIYAFFFSVLTYTSMYLIIVQRSFSLIALLPDKVLRWIGGQPEGAGEQAMQWGEEAKGMSQKGAEKSEMAQGQMGKQLGAYGDQALGGFKTAKDAISGGGASIGAQGGAESTPPKGK